MSIKAIIINSLAIFLVLSSSSNPDIQQNKVPIPKLSTFKADKNYRHRSNPCANPKIPHLS